MEKAVGLDFNWLVLQPCTRTTDLFSGQTVSSIIYLSCHFSHCRAPTVLTGAPVASSAVQPHFKELRCGALIQAPPEDGGGGGWVGWRVWGTFLSASDAANCSILLHLAADSTRIYLISRHVCGHIRVSALRFHQSILAQAGETLSEIQNTPSYSNKAGNQDYPLNLSATIGG